MKSRYIIGGFVIITTIGVILYFLRNIFSPTQSALPTGVTSEIDNQDLEVSQSDDAPKIQVVARNLSIPWGMIFLSKDELLITERTGKIVRLSVNSSDTQQEVRQEITVPSIGESITKGEGGLLGLAKHPAFASNNWIYVYQTYKSEGKSDSLNRVTRYTLIDDILTNSKVIIDDIPGAVYHDGGRIAFGPDGFLYITTGDATIEDLAQDEESLAGKILRLHDDGNIPADNPFGNAVYSLGHRNPQGLTWDNDGQIWSTEHGRSGIGNSGMDELNQISPGKNYGWPIIEGDMVEQGLEMPVAHSGPDETWAPASALYWDGSIFFAGLRGESLYEAKLDRTNTNVVSIVAHFRGEYGRLRTLQLGPDGKFYLTTSNTDGRAKSVKPSDDKIIRIDPSIFRQ